MGDTNVEVNLNSDTILIMSSLCKSDFMLY